MRPRMPRFSELLLVVVLYLLALAALAVAASGCAQSQNFVERDGQRYEERETKVFGVTVSSSSDPVPSEREQAVERVRGPLVWINRLALLVGIGGLVAAMALRSYGLQEIGTVAMTAGGVAWGATAAMLMALSYLIWAALFVGLGAAAIYLLRNRGLLLNWGEKAPKVAAEGLAQSNGGSG